ncbi:MAG: STM3941 family protein [Actinomycetaceae bacterium]|nr:STM3941 family protein [Actinomycetaceae bacterium]
MNQPYTVYAGVGGTFRLILLSVIAAVASIYILMLGQGDIRHTGTVGRFASTTFGFVFFKIIAVILLAMAIGAAGKALKSLLSLKPVIEVNSEGIVDRTTMYSPGLIRWEHITGVHYRTILGNHYIAIRVDQHHLESYTSRLNVFQRMILHFNRQSSYADFSIMMNSVKGDWRQITRDIFAIAQQHLPPAVFAEIQMTT